MGLMEGTSECEAYRNIRRGSWHTIAPLPVMSAPSCRAGYLIQKTYDGKAARTGGIESLRNVRSEALAVGPSKQLTSCAFHIAFSGAGERVASDGWDTGQPATSPIPTPLSAGE